MIETLKSILLSIIGIILILSYICWGILTAHRLWEGEDVEWRSVGVLLPIILVYAIVYWSLYIIFKIIAAFKNKRN